MKTSNKPYWIFLTNDLFTGAYGVEFLQGPLYDLNQTGEVIAGEFCTIENQSENFYRLTWCKNLTSDSATRVESLRLIPRQHDFLADKIWSVDKSNFCCTNNLWSEGTYEKLVSFQALEQSISPCREFSASGCRKFRPNIRTVSIRLRSMPWNKASRWSWWSRLSHINSRFEKIPFFFSFEKLKKTIIEIWKFLLFTKSITEKIHKFKKNIKFLDFSSLLCYFLLIYFLYLVSLFYHFKFYFSAEK